MQKFFSEALLVQLLNLLVKPVWILVIDRAVQNLLPPEQYVSYYSWLSFTILFVILLDLGINTYNNTRVAANPVFLSTHFLTFLRLKSWLSAGFFILCLSLALVFGLTNSELLLLVVLILYQIAVSYSQFLRSNVTALGMFRAEGVISVLDRIFVILASAAFIWIPQLQRHFNIELFVIIQLVGMLISLGVTYIILRPKLKQLVPRSGAGMFTEILKTTWPYALLVALMGLYTRVDAVMLRYFATDGIYETEAYAMGYRLLDAAGMLLAVLSGLLLPAFASKLKEPETLRKLSHLAYGFIFMIAWPALLAGFSFGEPLMTFLYPDKFNDSAPGVFSLLMGVLPASGIIFVFGALLTAAGNLKFLNRLAATAVLLNFCGNLILIPEYGSKGAALATLLTQGIFAIGCVLECYRHFHWKANMTDIGKWVSWSLLLLLIQVWGPVFGAWWMHSGLLLLVAVLLAFLFKLTGFNWQGLLKKR